MLQYLIMSRSLTYAQRASRALEHAGITAIVTKAPKNLSQNGCAYAIKVSEKRLADALRVLHDNDLQPGRVYLETKDSVFREVTGLE